MYIYIGLGLIALAVILYMFFWRKDPEEENLLDDVPNIYVNREELEKHAVQISTHYSETKKTNCKRRLIKSLDRSYNDILAGYDYIDRLVGNESDLVPAAEWLLDNLYLIEKEYKDIKHNMPESYYRNLPVISKGMWKRYPRIYHIAVEIVSHTDGIVDENTIEAFIKAYQKNTILTSGELWALPIMLRMALIQNIGHIVEKIVYAIKEKKKADETADTIINSIADKRFNEEIEILKSSRIRLTSHFVERIIKVLRDNGVDREEVYTILNDKLEADQNNIEKTINSEHHKEASYQLSLGNSITSIRAIAALNWRDSFERLSYVEQILKGDPIGDYSKMDFESRDYYRHKLEKISRKMNIGEAYIASKIVECAKEADAEEDKRYKKHIGYYVIDEGIDELKKKIGYKPRGAEKLLKLTKNSPVAVYIGSILLGVILLEVLVIYLSIIGDKNLLVWKYIIGAVVLIIPCSEIVIAIFNWSINNLSSPRFIPKLSLENGIPEECSTIVVIPTLLNNEKRVKELISDLEVYYLANKEDNLYFALLGDFKDSKEEHEENDEAIINAGLNEIRELNKKYQNDGGDIFYFLCRYRQYNEKQGIWLGWERKRGKLMEFNSLLRGDKNTSYNVVSGNIENLSRAKYVITLDADTQLPRDSAKRLIGAMSHTLNIPYVDMDRKKVQRGYGLMQPRVSVGTISANKTSFSRIFSGETGIDIYTTAVSDVYQDMFGEGIYTGKGIYDLDVFEGVLKNEIPENTVLSHDLLEGSYARCALVTDIELVDGYPAYYNANAKRVHRWVRGDWQLLPWLVKRSSLNSLSKWKIIDNLRRSLLTPSILLLVLLSLSILPTSGPWIIIAFIAIITPVFFDVSEAVVSPTKGINLTGRLRGVKMAVEQIFLLFCFIPYQAYLMVDAIIRTLYRMYVSRKNLLEWQTAADAEARSGKSLKSYINGMWPASVIAVIVFVLSFNVSLYIGLFMLPSSVLWFISPFIAYYISRDIVKEGYVLNESNRNMLRRISRETWAYFEDFVNSENSWLAPDNYQEDPANGVAHRTSPTNIGMAFTSNLSAYNLGYIGFSELVERLDKSLTSTEGLTRFKGHLYNWYDTITKQPLFPRYVSTVDSGNMVAYMWLCSSSLEDYLNDSLLRKEYIRGLEDTINISSNEIRDKLSISEPYGEIISNFKTKDMTLISWKKMLMELWSKVIEIEKASGNTNLCWNNKVKNDCSRFLGELQRFAPWVDIISNSDDIPVEIKDELDGIIGTVAIKNMDKYITAVKDKLAYKNLKVENIKLINELIELLEFSKEEIDREVSRTKKLILRFNDFVESTDFRVVYDRKRQLFSIGYDIEKDELNNSYYDLMASEARCASFIAIAKGDIEQKHWFKLNRSMTVIGRGKGLVSWSGTMFEYFMPLLIMKNYPDSLLDATYDAVIDGQKRYCRERRVPWGISESAFYHFDNALNYQYKAFGVPGIGLKRGLSTELVIAPYATVITLQKDLEGAVENISKLVNQGMEGRYGLYEAVDFTKERMPKGINKVAVKCFMVHHQGMSLMALDNALNNNILVNKFHSIPRVKATELLLQEKVPRSITYEREVHFNLQDVSTDKYSVIVRSYNTAKTEMPETHILSNGGYNLMISNSGSGYSKKEDMTVYRWREDATEDSSGLYFYIKNLKNNNYWSAGYEPCKNEGEEYQVIFSIDKVEFKRRDGDIATHTEITVSPEDDAEIRRISITNHGNEETMIEITSYCEVTLAPYNADIVHPTFSNLFISTEFDEEANCLIANRRPRAKNQKKPWMMQVIAVDGNTVSNIQYETSRLNFIGRGRTLSNPAALDNNAPLQNSIGAVLDPIMSMRRRIKIRPGETCKVAYTTGVAFSREEVIGLARKYRDYHNINRVFELAWTRSILETKYLGIKSTQANLYQMMASKILFINNLMREREKFIKDINKHQKDLWPYGISGDIPIIVLMIRHENDVDYVRQMLKAHEFWINKGLKVDLVVLNLEEASYTQPLQSIVKDMIVMRRNINSNMGGVYIHNKATMDESMMTFMISIARLVIDTESGSLIDQIKGKDYEKEVNFIKIQNVDNNVADKDAVSFIRNKSSENNNFKAGMSNREKRSILEKFRWNRRSTYSVEFSSELAAEYRRDTKNIFNPSELMFFNGYGGFNRLDNSYVILLDNLKNTPAPWINVVSNDKFGFNVSESGSAYTWSRNSRENKITPWSNDPVSDIPGEALFLRDEESGDYWSLTAKPVRDNGLYVVEHSFGYSTFTHEAYGIEGSETMFVPLNESCKIILVALKNKSDKKRKLSATYYSQLVLGVVPQGTGQYISTYIDNEGKYIYGQNPYSEHFGKLKAFLYIGGGEGESFTGFRREFIGRGQDIYRPDAMRYEKLSNLSGAGADPCLAECSKIEIEAGETKFFVVIFGQYETKEEITKSIKRYGNTLSSIDALQNIKDYWREILGRVQVDTPDKSMDVMLNGWLMYQTIACRYWSRTAFYQSGGAYGYRDQLQDSMSIGFLDSSFTREQILRSASRQFIEGDVQHWWHPVVDSGIRTRFSDDLLWLPYVTTDYINNTSDYSILEEVVEYLEDEPLKEGEDERYNIARRSEVKGTIYEHCVKTIDIALKFGPHNIPLMGSGDWNDGMSTVGNEGKGESVWLGWFLYRILDKFKEICKLKGDEERYTHYKDMQKFIKENIEHHAWDGNWYRRAYFDDGTPLGSIQNDECQIDSIAQSWSVISGGGSLERSAIAMNSLEKYLVKEDKGMILLLTPAFDNSKLEPGYIKGYVPGVRENGAQYTHAAIWAILAKAMQGDGDKAWQYFNMVNPINHSETMLEAERYKVEPYVMSADVYIKEPHTGRGGWSWYTGAAGWMYRVGVEAILGLKFNGDKGFTIEPVIPYNWDGFEMCYKKEDCKYNIKVKRGAEKTVLVDGIFIQDKLITYEKGEHEVEITI